MTTKIFKSEPCKGFNLLKCSFLRFPDMRLQLRSPQVNF